MNAPRSLGRAPVSRREPAELGELRARRREARRRVRLARLDLGLGVAAGLALIIFTPGLAIAGLIAILAIVLCLASVAGRLVLGRRRARRSRRPHEVLSADRRPRRTQ